MSVESILYLKGMINMDSSTIQPDLSQLELNESETESDHEVKIEEGRDITLENLGICMKPYGYALEYFDRRSLSTCFLCGQNFERYASVLEHLTQAHFLTITGLESVINVPLYFELRRRYQTNPDHDFSDKDDDTIRMKVRQSVLKEFLKLKMMDRCQQSSHQQCLFCKKVFQDDLVILLQHMFEEHGFNIGHSDNLIMIDVFLDILRTQLNALVCIYCYKQFPNFSVLHKHLRKKRHFKIDSKSVLYDQFYAINYLSRPEDPSYDSIEADEDSATSVNWTDLDDIEKEDTVCLFCEEVSPSPIEACEHTKLVHHFDFVSLCKNLELDDYSRIKLITFIRSQMKENRCPSCDVYLPTDLKHHIEDSHHLRIDLFLPRWKEDRYLIPIDENDPLLWYDPENRDEENLKDAHTLRDAR